MMFRMNVSDIMLLAVPFYRDNRMEGVIWGHASISRISEKIELDDRSHRYFQIIDDIQKYRRRRNPGPGN